MSGFQRGLSRKRGWPGHTAGQHDHYGDADHHLRVHGNLNAKCKEFQAVVVDLHGQTGAEQTWRGSLVFQPGIFLWRSPRPRFPSLADSRPFRGRRLHLRLNLLELPVAAPERPLQVDALDSLGLMAGWEASGGLQGLRLPGRTESGRGGIEGGSVAMEGPRPELTAGNLQVSEGWQALLGYNPDFISLRLSAPRRPAG